MNTWKEKTPRQRRVIGTYLLVSLPFMLAGMVASAWGDSLAFSIGQDDPLSMAHLVGLLFSMLMALIVSLAIGPQISIAFKHNAWCLDAIYGHKKRIDQAPLNR